MFREGLISEILPYYMINGSIVTVTSKLLNFFYSNILLVHLCNAVVIFGCSSCFHGRMLPLLTKIIGNHRGHQKVTTLC